MSDYETLYIFVAPPGNPGAHLTAKTILELGRFLEFQSITDYKFDDVPLRMGPSYLKFEFRPQDAVNVRLNFTTYTQDGFDKICADFHARITAQQQASMQAGWNSTSVSQRSANKTSPQMPTSLRSRVAMWVAVEVFACLFTSFFLVKCFDHTWTFAVGLYVMLLSFEMLFRALWYSFKTVRNLLTD